MVCAPVETPVAPNRVAVQPVVPLGFADPSLVMDTPSRVALTTTLDRPESGATQASRTVPSPPAATVCVHDSVVELVEDAPPPPLGPTESNATAMALPPPGYIRTRLAARA